MIRFQFRDPNIWCKECQRTKATAEFDKITRHGPNQIRYIGICWDCGGRCVAQSTEFQQSMFQAVVSV